MNPNSNYYLAFNTGFPNAYDRAWNYTGSELMVHGDCSSRGCYAMTDEQIQEIYALARESFFGGQKDVPVRGLPVPHDRAEHGQASQQPELRVLEDAEGRLRPFRSHASGAEGRGVREALRVRRRRPKIGKPLSFDPRGKCPAYQLDPAVADACSTIGGKSNSRWRSYIAATGRDRAAACGDGGMNPVFMAQLATGADNNGRYMLASTAPDLGSHVPGALPHVPNPPGTTIPKVGAALKPAPAPAVEPAPASEPAPPARRS